MVTDIYTNITPSLCLYVCTYVFVYLLGYTCMWVYAGAGSELENFWLLSLSVSLCVWLCVLMSMSGVTGVLSVRYPCVYVCLCSLVCRSCPVPFCLCLVLSPGSTLSAQSVPTMYPGQLALLAPGGLADSGSSTLLQPLKPSPSSDNLCSAYTSEAALSVPSLCAPTPGRHAAGNTGPHHILTT